MCCCLILSDWIHLRTLLFVVYVEIYVWIWFCSETRRGVHDSIIETGDKCCLTPSPADPVVKPEGVCMIVLFSQVINVASHYHQMVHLW